MKRENGIMACVVILAVTCLSGCGVTTLTEKESDLIAQYSAGILLNHTETYGDRLLPETVEPKEDSVDGTVSSAIPAQTGQPQVTEVPTANPKATEVPETATDKPESLETPDETAVPTVALNDIYQLPGVEISYHNYEFTNEYPKDSESYQISASQDEILLVVKFKVKNTTSKKKAVNLLNRQISYELQADTSKYKPTISVLENGGLNFLDTKIKSGASEEAVLVYALPKKVRDAKSISVTVNEAGKQSVVTVR